jgi:hypothetical protein
MNDKALLARAAASLALLLTLSNTAAANVENPPQSAVDLRNELRLDLGVASPVGELGLSRTRWISPSWAVEGGLGLGYTGLQLALAGKAAVVRGPHVFAVTFGPSLSVPVNTSSRTTTLLWANAELGYQYRRPSNWVLGVAAGATMGLAGQLQSICFFATDSDCRPNDITGLVAPMVRAGIGRRY